MKQKLVIALAIFLSSSLAAAETSKEYALMGRLALSAFKCSTLASYLDDKKEAERLLLLGYEQGNKFYKALGAGKIDRKDAGKLKAAIVNRYSALSIDFSLGRLYEYARDRMYDDELKVNDISFSVEETKIMAEQEFNSLNCPFIK